MDSQLILCIEEHESKKNPKLIDNRVFIGWSVNDNHYFVRGKRQDIRSNEFVPYAFRCESTNDLYDFIEFVIGNRKLHSIVLYNFNNLRECYDDDLTYEFFEDQIDKNYEIAAYDNVKLKRCEIKKYLRMLRNIKTCI
jgi:hypothetical protein